ncbi:hypothetical protein G6F70_004098 [Rhizopus microsporus]|nr:hypothetical protein G6F71_004119 [Rhizopus microsporus]KAG1200411.1 hypothetical protein G6F70_004098 [Rhizopus microsporus]KAG1212643.1 hypothetical protein G6F69_003538 [Rhizopus microsporus]KAG1234573.1 hypothetical protein G6F67_003436 [Rhizopus microsporus]KAG1260703.1 hypothetical protein G6F68_007245 [Rhizopus microsporus]
MPQATKRKRETGSTENFKEVRQTIRTLEASLSDKSNLNNIVDLFKFAKSDNPQICHAAIHALNRVFTAFLMKGDLKRVKNTDQPSAKEKVQIWLRSQYTDYLAHLRTLLWNDEPGLQLPALNILMSNIKSESEYAMNTSGAYHFANHVYGPIIKAIITNPNFNDHLRKEVVEKYLNVYDDLRHYFFKDAAEVMNRAYQTKQSTTEVEQKKKKLKFSEEVQQDDLGLMASNVLSILENISTMPTDASEIDEFWTVNPAQYENDDNNKKTKSEDDEILGDEGLLSDDEQPLTEENDQKKKRKHPLLQLTVHRRGFSDCWLAFLKLPLTEEMYKKILLILHKRILPHLAEPKLLMDFLTDSYNVGGAVSLLALNGLFTLIVDHNLDYPDFYKKLYTLLDRNVMHVKYRSRFFRLLELFLSSAYLPATLIAAFIKRLARLSLTAPPAACVIIIPFIYNLLKRHPTCMCLIHSNKAIDNAATDPFTMDNLDPYECKALDSSLWEVKTLTEHYYANVSTLAKIFSEQFLKPKYNLEDFLDHTYATFFTTEIDRKRKKEPALNYEKPTESVWEL